MNLISSTARGMRLTLAANKTKRRVLKTLLIKREYFKSLRILLSAATLLIIANKKYFQQLTPDSWENRLLPLNHPGRNVNVTTTCSINFPRNYVVQPFFVAFRSRLLLVIFHVVGIAAKRECLFSFPDRSSRLKGIVTLGGKV